MTKKRVTFPVPKNKYGIFAMHTSRPDILNEMSDEQLANATQQLMDSPAMEAVHQFMKKQRDAMVGKLEEEQTDETENKGEDHD